MTLIGRPPVDPPYDFYASFRRACKDSEYNPALTLDWFFLHGYVFKLPDFFMLACADPQKTDAWLVFWLESYPVHPRNHNIQRALKLMPYWRHFCGWQRGLKPSGTRVKYYSTSRLMALTKAAR